MSECETCGAPLLRKHRESPTNYARRRFCDKFCSSRFRAAGRTREVHHLLFMGESGAQIAKQLGVSQDALAHWLYEHDRPDLATRVDGGCRRPMPFWPEPDYCAPGLALSTSDMSY